MNLQNRSIILIGRRYGKNNTQPTCKNATFVNISVPPFIRPHYSASDSTLFYLLPFPFLSKFKFEHMTERVRKFFSRISRNRDQNTIFHVSFAFRVPVLGQLRFRYCGSPTPFDSQEQEKSGLEMSRKAGEEKYNSM